MFDKKFGNHGVSLLEILVCIEMPKMPKVPKMPKIAEFYLY
jgi:hypothetical protein